MGIFDRLVQEQRALVYDPLHPKDPGLIRLFGGRATISKIEVDDESALSSTAMFAGVRFLAENLGSVPLKIYQREGRGKIPLRDDRRWDLLQRSPNPEQTAMEFREMCVGFTVTTGNGYAEIVEGRDGIADALWPIVPWRVRPVRSERGALMYMVRRPDGREVAIPPERMLHFRGFSRNGILGDDVIERMKEAIGITIAADRSAAALFGHGAMPAGVLETDNALSEKAYDRIRKERDRLHSGVENWHRLAILEEGIKWQQISTDPEKAQLIETRKFQVTEVARILNLPPHVLKELDRSTFSNIEHQGLELVTYTLRPWSVRLEQVYEKRLLLPRERSTHIIRHNLGGFLRGDLKAQSEFFASARMHGYYSANDVREDLDLNSIGPQGDVYWAPINMVPADQFSSLGLPTEEGRAERRTEHRDAASERAAMLRKRTEAAFRPVFLQRLEALVRREANAVRNALKRAAKGGGVQEFMSWLDQFYEENAGFMAGEMRPVFQGLAEAIYQHASDEVGMPAERDLGEWVEGWSERFGADESQSSRAQIGALLAAAPLFADASVAVEERLGEWESGRPLKLARREIVGMGSKSAILAYRDGGVQRKVWQTVGGTCALCRSMNGRTVSIKEPFVARGEIVDPDDGETTPLQVERNFVAPPLHGGCDCTVVSG